MKSLKKCQRPKLYITPYAALRIDTLIRQTDKEIAWHGYVTRTNNIFTLNDIILFPQINSNATSTTDDIEYANWVFEHMEDPNADSMRLHGHSHVKMGVTPSHTDRQYRNDLTANIRTGFYVFMIVNQLGAHNIEIYDFEEQLIYENEDIDVIFTDPAAAEEAQIWAETQIKQYVKENTWKPSTTSRAWNTSTQAQSTAKYTSSDAEQLEEEFWRRYADWDSPEYIYGTTTQYPQPTSETSYSDIKTSEGRKQKHAKKYSKR